MPTLIKPGVLAKALNVTTNALRKRRIRDSDPYDFVIDSSTGRANYILEELPESVRTNVERITKRGTNRSHEQAMKEDMRYANSIGRANARRIAIHEAGHILASFILENVDFATRASILPRSGGSLGVTMFGANNIKNLRASELRDRLVMILSGKAAESHVFDGDSSTGASDDLDRATLLAKGIDSSILLYFNYP